MSVSIADFWRLLEESRLLTSEVVQRLASDYSQVKGASQQGNAKALVEWLIARNAVSRYQATVLMAGRSGPFYYGDYRVYDRIGDGRLSGWFRAVHGPTNHLVLLRFLTGPVTRDAEQWARTVASVLRQAGLVHPHLHRVHEPVDLVSFKFVVEEDLHGQSLDTRLTSGPLPPTEASRIMRLAALGLSHLHQQGEVHGDIRPANVWLGADGNVKLLRDSAKLPEAINFALPAAHETLQVRGDYLAPELGQPERPPSPLSDIYALGCTFYQALSGRPPYAGGDASHKLRRHASEPVQPLETFGIPQPLAQLVMYLMAKNPQVRYQQAAIVAEQLAGFVDPSQIPFQPPAAPPTLSVYESWIRQKQSALAAATPRAGASAAKESPQIVVSERKAAGGAAAVAVVPSAKVSGVERGQAKNAPRAARERKEMTPAKLATILGTTAVVLIAGLIALNSFSGGGGTQPDRTVAGANNDATGTTASDVTPTSAAATSAGTANQSKTSNVGESGSPSSAGGETPLATATVQQVVVDDPNLLWRAPTTGAPINFRYLPPGAQMFLILRPAALLESAEGERVLRALGPLFDMWRNEWEQVSGVKFADVDQLILGLHEEDNGNRLPRATSVVHLRRAMARAELRQAWGNPASQMAGSAEYFAAGDRAYYVPPTGNDRVFVIGAVEDIKETASVGGASPPLRRDIERLREASSADRHFTLLFAPNFLFSGGRQMFEGERAKLRPPIEWFLGDGLTAGMASMQLDDQAFYLEFRFASTIDRDKYTLASDFRDRLEQVPVTIEDYIVALNPHPYWRSVAFRYPAMIRFLHGNSRVGVQDDQAVINAVLPAPAAHNLVFGGSMLIESPPAPMVASTAPQPAAKGPQSLQELLATKTSMTFDQTALEFAMRDLAGDVNDGFPGMPFEFKIRIIGGHLEKDGITRNQQVRDINERDKPVAEILTAIVKKANPIPNVPGPSHPDQKLIWVVGPNPDNPSEKIVLVTTRTAAEENNYTLPVVFQSQN